MKLYISYIYQSLEHDKNKIDWETFTMPNFEFSSKTKENFLKNIENHKKEPLVKLKLLKIIMIILFRLLKKYFY